MFYLILLFTLLPALELYLLVKVGMYLGNILKKVSLC